ncbi:MAG: tryptophan synthase subunit alpha [Flavobacteriaceae bacterium]|nr:tryptophan synthase subunit alpha [Flavobacteriaceae bacterium]
MILKDVFKNQSKALLNIYFTAGFPEINSLPELINGLEKAGADLIEIGMPYSDPISDGPIIQGSNFIAIENGITTDLIFKQLAKCQTNIPLIMMGYFNAVFQYGLKRFCENCKATGVKGLIIPDLPMDEYREKYQDLFEQYGISFIFLVTPQTSEERIRLIDQYSSAFIYVVSSASTTGKGKDIRDAEPYLARLKAMKLKTPLMVGFNVSTKSDFDFASQYASGAIIGSAFIKFIRDTKAIEADTKLFVNSIKES